SLPSCIRGAAAPCSHASACHSAFLVASQSLISSRSATRPGRALHSSLSDHATSIAVRTSAEIAARSSLMLSPLHQLRVSTSCPVRYQRYRSVSPRILLRDPAAVPHPLHTVLGYVRLARAQAGACCVSRPVDPAVAPALPCLASYPGACRGSSARD